NARMSMRASRTDWSVGCRPQGVKDMFRDLHDRQTQVPMEMREITADKYDYTEKRGRIGGHRTISEYSFTIDRQVLNDRTNARYLIEENIRDDVYFDLKKGLETFTDKGRILQAEPCLHPLCKWACAQGGNTIKEVFAGAEFASWRGTINRIATTLYIKEAWTIVALKLGGVIILSEQSKRYCGNPKDVGTYSGFKFEQYMTTDRPNGEPDHDEPVDNRPTFEIMVRSDLSLDGRKIKLCCGAEIDALSGDEPVELKTANANARVLLNRNLKNVVQSEIVGVRRLVKGLKKSSDEKHGFIVTKVVEEKMSDMKATLNGEEEMCYAFLFDVLSQVKNFLEHENACEFSFDKRRGVVEIKPISYKTAERRNNGVTYDFKKKFNLWNVVNLERG
ncbi:hypothetical protein PFISCL1PPCAC_26237, partial [Pristionchus fissidentatus]